MSSQPTVPSQDRSREALHELQGLFAEISESWSELVGSLRALKQEMKRQGPSDAQTPRGDTPVATNGLGPDPAPEQGPAPPKAAPDADVTDRLNDLLAKVRARLDSARQQAPPPEAPGNAGASPEHGGCR